MLCMHLTSTGICNLFSHCGEGSIIYDREGRCTTKSLKECSIDNLNCDEEGYCLTENDDKYPDDSCDNYEI